MAPGHIAQLLLGVHVTAYTRLMAMRQSSKAFDTSICICSATRMGPLILTGSLSNGTGGSNKQLRGCLLVFSGKTSNRRGVGKGILQKRLAIGCESTIFSLGNSEYWSV